MYLNEFAVGLEPLDMRPFDEFGSLLDSAADLGIPHSADVRYVSRNIVLNHLRLHFLEWGDPAAPPVLLLHGGNQSAHSWDLVSLHLADRFHVFALDQRGHGDSEWARDADYSPQAMASDASRFLQAEGIARPVIVGHSMGGLVTLTLAVTHPDLPRTLVMVDIGPEISRKGTEAIRHFITHNVEFDAIEEFVQRVAAYDPFRSREHIARTVRYNLVHRADGKYASKSDRVLHDPDFARVRAGRTSQFPTEELDRLQFPVLAVRGEYSNVLEADAAERFRDALPDGQLVTVPNCGHNVHTQNTPGFLRAVRPFLESLPT